jgi:hypothetical protein
VLTTTVATTMVMMTTTSCPCVGCGAEANASRNCGVSYVPKAARAAEAVKADREKSNRAIAQEIGADEKTVRKARSESTADRSAVRAGIDGRTRRMPCREAYDFLSQIDSSFLWRSQ